MNKKYIGLLLFALVAFFYSCSKHQYPNVKGIYLYEYTATTFEGDLRQSANIIRFYKKNEGAIISIGFSSDKDRVGIADKMDSWFNYSNKSKHAENFFKFKMKEDSIYFIDKSIPIFPISYKGIIKEDKIIFNVNPIVNEHVMADSNSVRFFYFYPITKD